MKEIALSLMFHNEQSLAIIRSALDVFESQFHIHVNLSVLNWETGHSELNKGAIYGKGPDVSEIGNTWTSALIAMNAVRPFSPYDLAQIGKAEDFIPSSWNMGHEAKDERMYAIPYTANLYQIYYRKDLFRQAGLDEVYAFQSHAQIDETVKRLKQSGLQMPVVLPDDRHALLHSLASWIWARGGDFCSVDGKQVLFDQPESLDAICDYFGLMRHLSTDILSRAGQEKSIDLFCQGYSAIHFHDLQTIPAEHQMLPEVFENWGIAPFPKPYFIGGTNLVIGQHSLHVDEAIMLVKFLTSLTPMTQVAIPCRTLPSPRLTLISTPEFSEDPLLKNLRDATQFGRSYHPVKLWGVIEERFIAGLLAIRSAVLADPSVDLETLVRQKIVPIAHRLNIALSE
jgi:multiple sugar transport system substrate-binding protein